MDNNFNWCVETNPDIGRAYGSKDINGIKTCSISNLEYNTSYTWFINITEIDSNITTRKVYTFTTEKEKKNSDEKETDSNNLFYVNITKPLLDSFYFKNQLKSQKVVKCASYQAASTTNIDSATTVDMAGYESVLFIVNLGTMVNGSVLNLTIYQGATDDGEAASVATSGDVTSDGTDDTIILLEVVKPLYRYLEPVLTIATQNAVVENILAVVGTPRTEAVTQDSAVISDEIFQSPALA